MPGEMSRTDDLTQVDFGGFIYDIDKVENIFPGGGAITKLIESGGVRV